MGNLEVDMNENEDVGRWDWFTGIFIAIIIGLMAGYAWGWYHGEMKYERGYEAAAEELSIVIKGELCQD